MQLWRPSRRSKPCGNSQKISSGHTQVCTKSLIKKLITATWLVPWSELFVTTNPTEIWVCCNKPKKGEEFAICFELRILHLFYQIVANRWQTLHERHFITCKTTTLASLCILILACTLHHFSCITSMAFMGVWSGQSQFFENFYTSILPYKFSVNGACMWIKSKMNKTLETCLKKFLSRDTVGLVNIRVCPLRALICLGPYVQVTRLTGHKASLPG